MKAIVFDTEEHAKQWDAAQNGLTRSITRYKYNRVKLKDTTTLTKAEYAELLSIPEQLEDEDGVSYINPAYTSLEDSYTLHKCGLELEHEDAVDISDMIYVSDEL